MSEEEKLIYTNYLSMLEELKIMQGSGAVLFLDGKEANAEQIALSYLLLGDKDEVYDLSVRF